MPKASTFIAVAKMYGSTMRMQVENREVPEISGETDVGEMQ